MPHNPDLPEFLSRFLTEGGIEADRFRQNIRSINQSFAFVSVGVKIDEKITYGTGPMCFRIRGELHHRLGSILPPSTPEVDPATGVAQPVKNAFLQIYIHDGDTDEAVRIRRDWSNLPNKISDNTMRQLQTMLHDCNPYVTVFQQAHQIIAAKPAHKRTDLAAALDLQETDDRRRYNMPTVRKVAAIIPDDVDQEGFSRDLIVRYSDSSPRRISDCNPMYLPLHYVLLYPHGEPGWHPKIPYATTEEVDGEERHVTRTEYYAYYLHYRSSHPDTLFRSRKLFHQLIVDFWATTEQSKLQWIETNQSTLRADQYKGLMDVLATDQGDGLRNIGKRVILPSGHVNSTRFMYQLFQDSMAICRHYGHPDLFITFTANPQWKEIAEALLPGQKYTDRPDLVARVFQLKKEAFLHDLTVEGVVGKVVGHVHTIEFQKRGLPHIHCLVFLDPQDRIKTAEVIDCLIMANIPDPVEEEALYKIVTMVMLHEPCDTCC